jgi:8-oxo-dGTP pyrophosphatase MutT (NUDIX family)
LIPIVHADQGNEKFFLVGVTSKGKRKMVGGAFNPKVDKSIEEVRDRETTEETGLKISSDIDMKLTYPLGINYGSVGDTGMTITEFKKHFTEFLKQDIARYEQEKAEWEKYERGELEKEPKKPEEPELVAFDVVPATPQGIAKYKLKQKLLPSIPRLLELACVKLEIENRAKSEIDRMSSWLSENPQNHTIDTKVDSVDKAVRTIKNADNKSRSGPKNNRPKTRTSRPPKPARRRGGRIGVIRPDIEITHTK